MKKVSIFSLIAVLAIIISSCGSSNSVVSNHGISKRKYNKGFFFQRKSNLKTADSKVKSADLKEDKSIAKAKKVETRKAKKANRVNTSVKNNNVLATESIESTETNSNYVSEETVRSTFETLTEDGLNSEESEDQGSTIEESVKEMPYENRDQSTNEKAKDNQGSDEDLIFILAVIFAILLPPLGVAIYTNIDWMKVLIAFLLTLLFFLPGMIYALLVVFDMI